MEKVGRSGGEVREEGEMWGRGRGGGGEVRERWERWGRGGGGGRGEREVGEVGEK